MKIKVSEASRHVLDWMVKTAAGFSFDGKIWSDGRGYYYLHSDSPSTDWAQGGPILERERIATRFWRAEGVWEASIKGGFFESFGQSPLVAAMRCFVSSKLGDEVEVPDELV
jgi:hypothetical protein